MNLPPPFVPPGSVFYGAGVGRGLAIGPVHLVSVGKITHSRHKLTSPAMVEAELARLADARQKTVEKFASAQKAIPAEILLQDGDILGTHLMLLTDPLFFGNVEKKIRDDRFNAEAALVFCCAQSVRAISSISNEYLKSRVFDLETVSNSLVAALQEQEPGRLAVYQEGSVVVARDLSPSEIASLPLGAVSGVVTERGSRTSHSALVAKAIGLPMVVGVPSLLPNLEEGSQLIVDASEGHVIVNPDDDAKNFYLKRRASQDSYIVEINRCAHLPALTLDDHRVAVLGNIELVEELPGIMASGGEGVGLYRTEFMYMSKKDLPGEEELYESYRRVVATAAPRPVVIRTLDLGADKIPSVRGLAPGGGFPENGHQNQALGLRAIRFCLKNPGVFRTQLRAILRASVYGDVSIMLPMISNLGEIRRTKQLLAETLAELRAQNVPLADYVPVGVMIEVPAAAVIVRELAREADFLSIGTNDLIQYSLALDRTNPEVSDLYQPFHPAILRMIKNIIEAGRERGVSVSVCGDMAAEVTCAPVLVGLGADTLSMPSSSIPAIKRLLRMTSYEETKKLTSKILTLSTADEARDQVMSYLGGRFGELLQPLQ
ncbi:MAG: phosphoenolpyruvate--protein phosphotransferase [Deltaproteobacteria bacterium]|jgi:phosphotransferase system enzyme I (PtsI)|nr:phosphoenolpyruvate--protein phosphotransferase [Deltaproteobacteria bacterium]